MAHVKPGEHSDPRRTSKEPIMAEGSHVFFRKDKPKDFDLEFVHDALVRCHGDDGILDLGEYLSAYHELCRFFKLTGRLFGFVAADMESKIRTIEHKINGPNGEHYTTIQGMLQYEVDNGIATVKGRAAAGSRTLLRLHWALEFILEFMHRISISGDDDRTSVIAPEVYAATLSKHHPWFTKKLAAFAMYFLPSRKDLIDVMCKQSYSEVLEMLEKVVQAGTAVYRNTEETYAKYDLMYIK